MEKNGLREKGKEVKEEKVTKGGRKNQPSRKFQCDDFIQQQLLVNAALPAFLNSAFPLIDSFQL